MATLSVLAAGAPHVALASTAQPLVRLESSVTPARLNSDRVADLQSDRQVNLQLALNLRDESGLQDLIRRVSTPGSPEYGHYLTPQQFADRFGPTREQVNAAVAYLQSSGLTVTSSAPGSILVNATGSAGRVSSAMHTSLGLYRGRSDGREYYANDSAPALPADLASIVQAVHGLDSHAIRHSAAAPCMTCANPPYSPNQIRAGYDFNAAPLSGLTGTGQTMGLLELNTYQQSNVDQFDTTYSLTPPAPLVLTVPGGAVPNVNIGEVEVELDIEVMQGIAPAANIMVFEAANSDVGVNNGYSCMADQNALGSSPGTRCPNWGGATAPSNSTSWGLCEADQGATETGTLHSIFSSAAALGHSFYAASGDTGTNDNCSVTPAVDSPASDPSVTGTGGTKLFLNQSTNTWFDESAWPAEPQSTLGGGGGLSTVFARPSWQVGPGVQNSFSNGKRQVPDVSANADPVTGWSVYTCKQGTDCLAIHGNTNFYSIGGTSAAAPAWAAFTAIYNQYAASLAKPVLRFANPTLYAVNRCTASPFHDITTGTNANNSPFTITSGWDYLTGLGSFDAATMASKIANLSTLCPVDPGQSTVTAAPGSVAGDGVATSTITVTLKDFVNNPVSGKAVTLARTAGPGAPVITGPAPATTDVNGQTIFTVKSTTMGTDTFQATDATDSSQVITQTASVTFTVGTVNAGHSTVSASPGTVAADGITTSTVTVTLKDVSDSPISGKAVALAKSSGPGNPVINGPAPATTGGNGQTTFTVKSTTAGSDTFQATDTTDGNLVITQTASVTFSVGAVNAGLSMVSANPTSVPADGATSSTITVTLKDAQSNAVSGKAVTLAKSAGPGAPVITGPAPASTDSNGQTTFTVKSTTAGLDTFRATDTTDGNLVITQTASVTFSVGAVNAGLSTVSANPPSVPADGAATSTITVTLKDAQSNAVSGKAVTLAKSAGPGAPMITGPTPATTDSNGQTTFTVKSITTGTDTFRATDTTDSNLVITQTADVTFGAVSGSLSTVSANPTRVVPDGVQSSTVTVTLKDANGTGVSGKSVSLAKTAGPGSPSIGAASGLSSGSGQVTFAVTSTSGGTDTFQATDTTDNNLVITQTATIDFHSDDSAWDGWSFLAGSVTGPAIARNSSLDGSNGRLEVFGLSPDHTAWHAWQGNANGPFSASASLGGSLAFSPSVGQNLDGRLELFAEGTDGSVYHNWQTSPSGGWSGWYGLGGGVVGTPTVTSDADGRLELLVLAHDHSVYHSWQQTPGSGWTGWYPLGGSLATTPNAGLNADGRVEIFARGTDGTAQHAWQTVANGGWSGWASLGGQIAGSPTVGTNADGRLEMFAIDQNSTTYHNWQVTAGSGWFGWAIFSGSLTAAPTVARTASGRLFVFGTNLNGNVYRQVQDTVNGNWAGWTTMGGSGLVNVAAGTNLDGRIELIAQDSGGSLWHDTESQPPT